MTPKRFKTEEEWLAHEAGELRAAKWMYAMLAATITIAVAAIIWRIMR